MIDQDMPSEDVVQLLSDSSKLKQSQNLIGLDFSNCQMSDSLTKALAQATHLQHLTNLNLKSNQISAKGVHVLTKATHLQQLTSLNLSSNPIGDEGAHALAQAKHMKFLTSLHLRTTQISGVGIQALVNSKNLQNLTELNLQDNDIGSKEVQALVEGPHLRQLTNLNLKYNRISAEGVKALTKTTHLQNLTSLNLSSNLVDDIAALALAQATHLRHLNSLNLNNNYIGVEGARHLAKATHLQQLTNLNLGYNQIGCEGVQALAKATHLQHLTELNLRYNHIGFKGIQTLSKATHLQHLTHLNLGHNQIGSKSVHALADSKWLSDDVELEISGNKNVAFVSGKLKKLRQLIKIQKYATMVPDRLIRVMLIGPPYGGKTTLFRAMSGSFSGFDKHQERTQGFSAQVISMNDVQHERELIPLDTGAQSNGAAQPFELDLWDLGGHSLQRVLHRLFFKGDVYFLLVLNHQAPEETDAIRAWLEPLVFLKGQGVLNPKAVVPVKNPHLTTLKDCATTLEDRDIDPILAPYTDALNLHKPIGVPVIFDNDGHNPAFDLDFQLWPTLRYLISQAPPKERWQVLDELGSLIKNWQEPLLTSSAFYEKLETNTEIQSVLNRFYPQVPDLAPVDFMDALISYLDHAGIIRWLEPVDLVVLKPEWVCLGFYALLPPEPLASPDEDQKVPEHVRLFREKLQSPDSTVHGLPGVFDRSTALNMLTALSYYTPSGLKYFTLSEAENLFKILCSPELGLVVELKKVNARFQKHFFIPLYLDLVPKANENDIFSEEQTAKQILKNYQDASVTYVIESGYWPEHMLYQLMVALWPGNLQQTDGAHDDDRPNNKNSPKKKTLQTSPKLDRLHHQRILLEATNGKAEFELMFYEKRIWCFVKADQQSDRSFLIERIREIKKKLYRLIVKRDCDDDDDSPLTLYIPCANCMDMISERAQESEVDAPIHSELKELSPSNGMFEADPLERDKEESEDCGHSQGSHKHTYLSLHMAHSTKSGPYLRPAGQNSPAYTMADLKTAIVHVTLFLYHTKEAKQTSPNEEVIAFAKKDGISPTPGLVDIKTLKGWWDAEINETRRSNTSPKTLKPYASALCENAHLVSEWAKLVQDETDDPLLRLIHAAEALKTQTQSCLDLITSPIYLAEPYGNIKESINFRYLKGFWT